MNDAYEHRRTFATLIRRNCFVHRTTICIASVKMKNGRTTKEEWMCELGITRSLSLSISLSLALGWCMRLSTTLSFECFYGVQMYAQIDTTVINFNTFHCHRLLRALSHPFRWNVSVSRLIWTHGWRERENGECALLNAVNLLWQPNDDKYFHWWNVAIFRSLYF